VVLENSALFLLSKILDIFENGVMLRSLEIV
jgi:hypothetical protein